jgi:hypothetical protein
MCDACLHDSSSITACILINILDSCTARATAGHRHRNPPRDDTDTHGNHVGRAWTVHRGRGSEAERAQRMVVMMAMHGYDIATSCVNGFIHSRRALFFCRLVLEPHSTHARHSHTSLVPWWCSLSPSGPPLGGYIGHQPGAQDGAGCNNRCLERLSTQHSAGARPPNV